MASNVSFFFPWYLSKEISFLTTMMRLEASLRRPYSTALSVMHLWYLLLIIALFKSFSLNLWKIVTIRISNSDFNYGSRSGIHNAGKGSVIDSLCFWTGFSGADLQNMVNTAAIRAAVDGKVRQDIICLGIWWKFFRILEIRITCKLITCWLVPIPQFSCVEVTSFVYSVCWLELNN